MGLNQKHTTALQIFIALYTKDEEFKMKVQQAYDDNPYALSILDIYALEDILRYGVRGYYNKFLNSIENEQLDRAIDLYNEYRRLLELEPNFMEYKLKQLKDTPETMSDIEKLVLEIFSRSEEKKYEMHYILTEEMEYDPLNKIAYATDDEIRETLENLLIGEFINKMLELPGMWGVKARQKGKGLIAKEDKPVVIKQVQSVVFADDGLEMFKKAIDYNFLKVKMKVLSGNGETAFGESIQFNTNISAYEIFGVKKDNSEEEANKFFEDVIQKRKNPTDEMKK